MSIPWFYALQSMNASATNEIHYHRFDRVITMMRHENIVGFDAHSQLFKIIIAQFSRCHFYTHLMQRSVSECVKMHAMEWYCLPFTQFLAKSLIPVCLFST